MRGSVALGVAALVAGALVAAEPPAPGPEPTSFAVLALSRGKGVPEAAREALRKVEEAVEADRRRGVKVELKRTRFGLEGETKLCVEYASAVEARRARERAEAIVKDVDLVNLVPGPCTGKAKPEGKEEGDP